VLPCLSLLALSHLFQTRTISQNLRVPLSPPHALGSAGASPYLAPRFPRVGSAGAPIPHHAFDSAGGALPVIPSSALVGAKEKARLGIEQQQAIKKKEREDQLRHPKFWQSRFGELDGGDSGGTGKKLTFLKRAELVETLKANGLPHAGRNAQLVERLRTWIEDDMCQAQLKDLERLRQQRTYQQATSDKTYSFG
jgi:hypothetical protein